MAEDERLYDLMVGDPMPPLQATDWLSGEPIGSYEPGVIYAIDFWQTWCGGCILGFPELVRLQERFGDHLRVVLIAAPQGGDTLEAVRAFVQDGGTLGLRTAFDGDHATTRAIKRRASLGGFPCLVFVDGHGRMAAVGHSAERTLEELVESLLEGNFDLEAEAARYRASRALGENFRRFKSLLDERRFDEALALLGEARRGPLGDHPATLASAGLHLLDHRGQRGWSDRALALELAQDAYAMAPEDEAVVSVLALALTLHGRCDEGADLLEGLLPGANEVMRPIYEATIAEYRAAAQHARQNGG